MADRIITPATDLDKAAIKVAYSQVITDLQGFQSKTSWTNAEAVVAIKRLAEIQEKLLRFLKRQIDV